MLPSKRKSQEVKRWRGICRFHCFNQSIGPKSVNGPGLYNY